MFRVCIIILIWFWSIDCISQTCPRLTSPLNGSTNVSVDATITWNSVEGVPGYLISIGTTPGGKDIISSQTGTNSFSPPLGLPDNTQIYVTITLFFFNLPNIVCSSESFITQDITSPPLCTRLLSPKNGNTNINVGSNISWYYVSGADGYRISIGTSAGLGDLANNVDVGNILQFNPASDFSPLTQIFVKIVPYNENGNLLSCVEESFLTGNVAALPDCTTLISPINGETNVALSPLIEWEPVLGATGYKIFIGTSPYNNDILEDGSFSTNSTFVFNFEPNKTYFIRILPFNSSGEAIGCQQDRFSTILGCGPFYDPKTGTLKTLYPEINFPDAIEICSGNSSTLISSLDNADGYRWFYVDNSGNENLISSSPDVFISTTGDYRYEVFNLTESGLECPASKYFNVSSFDKPRITNVKRNGNLVEVEVFGLGIFEYAVNSIDGPYQNSNIFYNGNDDIISVFVRDKNGCGVAEYRLTNTNGFPAYFTPNADGYHDYWQYVPKKNDNFKLTDIFIYDRYGKLIKQINPMGQGWNGTLKGQQMPSSDYWYNAITNKGTSFIGHFALKR